jgi:PadR family transcriptional regulator, regulatory protein PadR
MGTSAILEAEKCRWLPYQELLAGLVRLYVLHHAADGEIYGMRIIDDLGRHGCRFGAGTLYPKLHTVERKGCLQSRQQSGRSIRAAVAYNSSWRQGSE